MFGGIEKRTKKKIIIKDEYKISTVRMPFQDVVDRVIVLL